MTSLAGATYFEQRLGAGSFGRRDCGGHSSNSLAECERGRLSSSVISSAMMSLWYSRMDPQITRGVSVPEACARTNSPTSAQPPSEDFWEGYLSHGSCMEEMFQEP